VKAPAKPKETTAAAKKKAAAASIVDDSDDSDAGGAMQVDATDGETDGSPEKKQPLREIGGQAGKGKDNSEMYQKVRCWTKGLGKDLRQEPDWTPSVRSPQLSQIEHILKRPDSYIGSVQHITQQMWVFDYENKKMVNRCVSLSLR
jgi:DNA topoisomerase-2